VTKCPLKDNKPAVEMRAKSNEAGLKQGEFFENSFMDNKIIKIEIFALTRLDLLISYYSLEWTVNDSRVPRRGAFLSPCP
jgi:hypothetical protein